MLWCLQPAPRHGLTRPRGVGGAGGAGGRGGFVPPFVGKAIDHHTGGGGAGGGAGGAAAAGAGGEEGPLSARTLEMLGGEDDARGPVNKIERSACALWLYQLKACGLPVHWHTSDVLQAAARLLQPMQRIVQQQACQDHPCTPSAIRAVHVPAKTIRKDACDCVPEASWKEATGPLAVLVCLLFLQWVRMESCPLSSPSMTQDSSRQSATR